MRVTMDQVWERVREVVAGRAGVLASIAAATIWLPVVVEQAIVGMMTGGLPAAGGSAFAAFVLTIAVAIIGYWGRLAIVAVASGAEAMPRDALRAAARRLPVLLGLLLVAILVIIVLLIPVGVAIAPYATQLSGQGSMEMSGSLATLPVGITVFVSLYLMAMAVVLLWLVVRLLAVSPVVLLERRGLASFRCSFEMTRGHFWRLLGVLLLFLVVVLVATGATHSVVGVFARVVLGPAHPAIVAFVATLFTAAVAASASVLAAVFVTRFYLLRTEGQPAP